MLVAQPLIQRADIGGFAQFEREAQRVERRPPYPPVGEGAADDLQRLALLGRNLGAFIGDIARGRRAFEQQRALAIVGGPDLRDAARQPQPARAVLRRHRDDLPEQLQAEAEIVLLERLLHLAAKLGRGLRHLPGIGLDLAFEPDRGLVEVFALERPFAAWSGLRPAANKE